jgi:PhnB protein
VTSVEPELWVGDPAGAIDFYARAFGAAVVHRVGHDGEVVAQLQVGDARFWLSNAAGARFDPLVIGGRTGRTLLVTDKPEALVAGAVEAGAQLTSAVSDEHGWRLGRIVDPFGHEWEIGHPTGDWPPS